MIVLIPIEISSRELLYRTYLCHLLAKKGFICYLGLKRNISYLIDKFDGFIYLDKGYHEGTSDKLYSKIKKKKSIIINLDDEGAIDFPDGSILKNRYSEKMINASEKIFLWGNYQYNLLKERNIVSSKIIVTGHPRFELLKSKYHNFYEVEVRAILKRFGNFILINSNFGFGNNIKGDDFVIKNYGSRIKRIVEIVDFDKVKRESYIQLAKKLAIATGKSIIYRPHPEEDKLFYKTKFTGFKNIKIVYEGSVVPWIIASDLMIHPDCTTSIEAFMLGKKTISFLPQHYDPNLVTKLPLEVSYKYNNIDDVVHFIQNDTYKNNRVNIADYDIIDDYFSFSKNSSQIIVDEISQFMSPTIIDSMFKISFKEKVHFAWTAQKSKIVMNKAARLSKNKLKGFNYKEIEKIHEVMIKMDAKFLNVDIKKIANGLFLIQNIL